MLLPISPTVTPRLLIASSTFTPVHVPVHRPLPLSPTRSPELGPFILRTFARSILHCHSDSHTAARCPLPAARHPRPGSPSHSQYTSPAEPADHAVFDRARCFLCSSRPQPSPPSEAAWSLPSLTTVPHLPAHCMQPHTHTRCTPDLHDSPSTEPAE
ncbi:hypothetical protein P3342_007716 [Pyrenophora teres f. teres]|nr:hypothetical protein P3342_007716 [Pyrenophora teres f. teres]